MNKFNETVSSDQGSKEQTVNLELQELNTETTSEETNTVSAETTDLFEEGTSETSEGNVESVEGFDESYVQNEGVQMETFQISQELINLPTAGSIEYSEQFAESICGRDGRTRITRTANYPWRAICQLIITMNNGAKSRCTGWFIGPRTVMTAGHCVFSRAAGGWARSIEVIPGMNDKSRPYGSQIATSFRSVLGWTRDRNSDYDYGAIILPNNALGSRVGWFGFAAYGDTTLQNMVINNSGYAGDKPFGTQWFNAGKVTKVTSRKIEYMIDTYGGHSGSPVWQYTKGSRYAVGVHAYGGCPNKSVRITKSVFNNMLNWKNV